MEDEAQIPAEAMMFLALNTGAVEGFIEEVINDLDHMSEDYVQVKLLDNMYDAEAGGISIAAFQNMAAAAILLLAIERKKGKS